MSEKQVAFLPYGMHGVDETDIQCVAAVLRSAYLTTGPVVPQLEAALSARMDGAYVVVCSNGTAALHMMSMALPVKAGDVLVAPAITFLATANAARYVGAEVEFADVDPSVGLMTPESLEAAILRAKVRFGKTPAAATTVHIAGQVGDLLGLQAVAKRHGAVLMEDAAHAVGGEYNAGKAWLPVGGGHHSAMTAFSFHPVKTMTMGEGGAVATRDPVLAQRLALARNHGMERNPKHWLGAQGLDEAGAPLPWYYEMQEPGYNYRATDIQAALGLSQLEKLDQYVARRAALVDLYHQKLSGLSSIVTPLTRLASSRPGWHLFVVLIDFARLQRSRAEIMRQLQAKGIGTQVHYIPLHFQPYYRNRYGKIDLPGAEAYYGQALSLPLFPAMQDADVDRVVDTLTGLLQ